MDGKPVKPNDIMIAKVFSADINKDNIAVLEHIYMPKFIACIVFSLIAAVLMIALLVMKNYLWILLLVGLLICVFLCVNYWFLMGQASRDALLPINVRNSGQFYFYRDRVIYSDNTSTLVLRYKHILKAVETKDYFILYVTSNKGYAAPKAGFMFPDEKDVLSKFLAVKLDSAYKVK